MASLCGACSIAVDPDRAQCLSDSDCARRGGAFTGSVCVDALCSAPSDSPCTSGVDCPGDRPGLKADACAGNRCQDASTRDAKSADPSDARVSPRVDASTDEPSDPDQPGDGDEGTDRDDNDDPADDDASSGPPPECTQDQDCVERGPPGSLCVDQVCWVNPAPMECSADNECSGRGPEFEGGKCVSSLCRPNPRWRCERPALNGESGMVTLTALVRDSLSLDPLPNIRAVVCQKLDLDCAEPVGAATTNAGGDLTFTVPHDFAGYLRVEDSRFFPALYSLPAAFPQDGRLQPFPLLGAGLVDALAISIGSTIDRRRGHMMLVAEDCFGAALPGVTFRSPQQDDATIQFYVQDLLPSASATETSTAGNGGYLNFPAGNTVIDVSMEQTKLMLTRFSLVVRPSFITVAYVRPELR